MEPIDFYKSKIVIAEQLIRAGVQKVRLFTMLRLLVFVVFATPLYFAWGNTLIFSILLATGFILFLLMVSLSVDAKLRLEKARELKKINENEVKSLSGDWSAFDKGLEFIDGKHPFSNDLDLFSNKGVFGFLNRTITLEGKKSLAKLLLNGSENPERNNEVIEALSEEMDWTQTYRIAGSIASREMGARRRFADLVSYDFKNPKWIILLIYLIPLCTIPAVILYNFDLISGAILGVIVIAAMFPTVNLLKSTNAWAEKLSAYETKVAMMCDQVNALQNLRTDNPELNQIRNSLTTGELSAEKALKEWLVIGKRFDLRMNIVVSIPLNIFVAWDLRQRHALTKWFQKYGASISSWEETLTEMEVFISGATIKYNYPATIFADFSALDEVKIQGMIHPLLADSKVVSNNVEMTGENQFMILTGPNMAGKSTYLRGLGLIFVFANAGFPVFAKSVVIPRVKLYSSMRTTDDLSNESSYFHAELMRLRFIMDALEGNQKIFILLDEILKGTNSKDKEEGSRRFLKKLQTMGAKGVIATHDLSLCQLSEQNDIFNNGCFDSTIEGENLYFDYLWRPGICQNMNASFLLKQMKLVD